MDAFRMMEPRDVSKITRPIPSPPPAPSARSPQPETSASPQDRTKTPKVSEHRPRAPIQFMLNKTSHAGRPPATSRQLPRALENPVTRLSIECRNWDDDASPR